MEVKRSISRLHCNSLTLWIEMFLLDEKIAINDNLPLSAIT